MWLQAMKKNNLKIGDFVLVTHSHPAAGRMDDPYINKIYEILGPKNQEGYHLWKLKGVDIHMSETQLAKGPFTDLEKIIYGISDESKD
jgi:hypothetical protein